MTIQEVKELVDKVKNYPKNEIFNISTHLSFFDRVNFVMWLEKLHNIKIAI